jgi:phytoene synthase
MNLSQPEAVSAHPAARRSLSSSYAFCEELARRQAGNFYHAFRLLPRPQRQAMCALYAFMRVADDLADAAAPASDKAAALDAWRQQLHDALAGVYHHPLHAALHHTIRTFAVPSRYLEEVLDGVTMDLVADRYDTFADLYRYCYHVASAVGLACIHIWGFTGDKAMAHAEAAGLALQMTNILRDLGEDAARGRVYLPREDLERFGYPVEGFAQALRDDRFRALMEFEAARTRSYYEAGELLTPYLHPPGRAVFLVMLRTYRGLLDAIVGRDYDVFTSRVRLPRWKKLWLAARALPVRWGWA